MKHINPEEFMTKGQRFAMKLADEIEHAGYFNMHFWVRPGADRCPSCIAGWAVAVAYGREALGQAYSDTIMEQAAHLLGFSPEQAYEAFVADWVRRDDAKGHNVEHRRRAVALLRHYAHTGEVNWQASPRPTMTPSVLSGVRAYAYISA